MGSVAASGGYWIATECDHLIASEQTITGSIGVFGLLPNLKEFASKYGVYWDAVKTHPHSDLMGISRPKSEAEIKVIQTYVDQLYGKFIRLVAKARGIPENKVNQLAEEGFGVVLMQSGRVLLTSLEVFVLPLKRQLKLLVWGRIMKLWKSRKSKPLCKPLKKFSQYLLVWQRIVHPPIHLFRKLLLK